MIHSAQDQALWDNNKQLVSANAYLNHILTMVKTELNEVIQEKDRPWSSDLASVGRALQLINHAMDHPSYEIAQKQVSDKILSARDLYEPSEVEVRSSKLMMEENQQLHDLNNKLEAIIQASLRAAPVGDVRNHTPENLPVIVDDLATQVGEICSELDSMSTMRLEEEVHEEFDKTRNSSKGWTTKESREYFGFFARGWFRRNCNSSEEDVMEKLQKVQLDYALSVPDAPYTPTTMTDALIAAEYPADDKWVQLAKKLEKELYETITERDELYRVGKEAIAGVTLDSIEDYNRFLEGRDSKEGDRERLYHVLQDVKSSLTGGVPNKDIIKYIDKELNKAK